MGSRVTFTFTSWRKRRNRRRRKKRRAREEEEELKCTRIYVSFFNQNSRSVLAMSTNTLSSPAIFKFKYNQVTSNSVENIEAKHQRGKTKNCDFEVRHIHGIVYILKPTIFSLLPICAISLMLFINLFVENNFISRLMTSPSDGFVQFRRKSGFVGLGWEELSVEICWLMSRRFNSLTINYQAHSIACELESIWWNSFKVLQWRFIQLGQLWSSG